MKNINALKKFKGNSIVELIKRLQSIETTRPDEFFYINFQIQVKTGEGVWHLDCDDWENVETIVSYNPLEDLNWREEVAKYLAHIDMDFAYEWDDFCVQTWRSGDVYDIDVFLRRKTTRQ